ncbi:osmoprotectant ABC transporter substrate-binding protein [Lactobacillus sp. DCY120]|uniref:Osmoprotectant ABC transporter substrate-binding protein n=1 Tax=Bombilactobacillus apium TaxID=2675299 RepID=A0A850R7J7_9LACO|nr:osmoprotectant ABC transporter substrate-binding protein [Bombilactobacillus apium]NVY96495.1 osmoprotectant ABC transporter substrate-binding protein [Bombilactobacillus apium]
MKKLRYLWLTFITLGSCLLLGACSFPGLGAGGGNTPSVKIASLNTTESQVMANMLAELISHETKYPTEIVNNLGSAPLIHQALVRNDADIQAVAYSGTELTTNLYLPPEKDPQKATDIVRREAKKRFDQTYFPTYGFSNTFSFMVTQKTARENNLKTVSDLKKVADKFTVGVDANWLNRKGDGYRDFTHHYDLEFAKAYPMQIGLVYSALASNKMNVVLGYSTDGRIDSYHLKSLQDDKHFFPPYNCSMMVNNSLLRQHPELKPILHRLDGKISVHTMRRLNFQVDDQLLEPQVVAHQFLVKNNYFRGEY